MPKVLPLTEEQKLKRKGEELGIKILKEMDKQNVSQTEMARVLGITPQAFGKKAWGRTDFKAIELIMIFNRLKSSPETINHLLGWKDV